MNPLSDILSRDTDELGFHLKAMCGNKYLFCFMTDVLNCTQDAGNFFSLRSYFEPHILPYISVIFLFASPSTLSRMLTYQGQKCVTIATPCNIVSKTEYGKHCCCCCPNSERWDDYTRSRTGRNHSESIDISALCVCFWSTCVFLLIACVQEFVATLLNRVFEAGFCSNQASVKYLIEWVMVLILVHYPQHIESFWASFSMVSHQKA